MGIHPTEETIVTGVCRKKNKFRNIPASKEKHLSARCLLRAPTSGGSFSISNLGMFGIDNFDAVINPPQSAILAVGTGKKRPVVGPDGDLTVATTMSVTLSVDHRAVDGALGAQLLDAIVKNLENPISLLV